MASNPRKGSARKKASSSPRDPSPAVNLDSPSAVRSPRPPQVHVPPTWQPQGAVPPTWPLQGGAPPTWPPSAWPNSSAGAQGGQSTSPNSTNPWGSYFNVLQQPQFPPMQLFGENSHFVGVANSANPPSPVPAPPTGRVTIDIDVDDGVEANRGVKKRFWSHDEEVRLASAWLNTSKDPINGNDKRSESFWGQITEKFNKDSQPDRIRDTNQLKVHWSRLSTTINEFNGYWSSVCKINKSGYSDDQLMDDAQRMFTKKNGKPFAHVHWWRILRAEPKWCAFVAQTEKDKKKTTESDNIGEPRPIGREAAKAERKGKRKAEQLLDGIVILGEKIDKIDQVAQDRKKEREIATEAQLEITRMNLKCVEGQKEVKLLQLYNTLLTQDTSTMTDEEKASHSKTMQWMIKKIMATGQVDE